MSHGDRDSHRQVFQDILSAADQLQGSVGILLDLCGPKIRTGRFENGAIELSTGDVVTITTRPRIGTSGIIVSQYEGLCRDCLLYTSPSPRDQRGWGLQAYG